MRKTALMGLAAAAIVAAVTVVPTAAQGSVPPGPTPVSAGCKTASKSVAAGVLYSWYGADVVSSWCWTKGNTATSQIYNVSGDITSYANFPAQTQSDKGPVNSSLVPIQYSTKFAQGAAVNAYYTFQNRTCATGQLGFLCTSWHLLKSHMVLGIGGSWTYVVDSNN